MNDTHAKRSLGQNWLTNTGVADRIVQAAQLTPESTVLEVGPGKGILTERLLAETTHVIAIEKDHRLIGGLHEQFSASGMTLREGDILEFDPSSADLEPYHYTVVANLPYYITSRFLRVLLTSWPAPRRAVLMMQREVSRRIMAKPGDMTMLALSVQAYADVEKIMDVSRGSFRPQPDVDSTILALSPKRLDDNQRRSVADALRFAKKAFLQRRKKLSSTITDAGLSSCNIDPSQRPQELSVEQWLCIADART